MTYRGEYPDGVLAKILRPPGLCATPQHANKGEKTRRKVEVKNSVCGQRIGIVRKMDLVCDSPRPHECADTGVCLGSKSNISCTWRTEGARRGTPARWMRFQTRLHARCPIPDIRPPPLHPSIRSPGLHSSDPREMVRLHLHDETWFGGDEGWGQEGMVVRVQPVARLL